MITTTYTCDKCGKSVVYPEQLWYVRVQYCCDHDFYGTGGSSTKTLHWCRPCLETTGIIPCSQKAPIPDEKKLSLEDLIREIVREEMPVA